jgi:hypothetical protein
MRTAWNNRFERPFSADFLLAQLLDETRRELAAAARSALLQLEGVTESVEWLGVPWRWTLVYRSESDAERPLAYLVPEPARPQLAIPMTVPMIRSLPARRLKKFVRDAIVFSRAVADVHWPTWELTARPQLDDVLDLVARKHRFLTAEPAPAVAAV